MPRRITDYPDAYEGWNYVSSVGSVISVVATAVFLYTVYDAIVSQPASVANPWGTPAFFNGAPTVEMVTLANPTIEWAIPSPTPFHAYYIMPIQS